MFGARSGWAAATPVSTTATVTEPLPAVTSQAAGAETLLNPQAAAKPGSSGIMDVRKR